MQSVFIILSYNFIVTPKCSETPTFSSNNFYPKNWTYKDIWHIRQSIYNQSPNNFKTNLKITACIYSSKQLTSINVHHFQNLSLNSIILLRKYLNSKPEAISTTLSQLKSHNIAVDPNINSWMITYGNIWPKANQRSLKI